MEYGIKEVANLTGLTTRTLRYYDEIDLLKPSRVGDNGYRFYESKKLETLQQIMFYRKRGFELKEIKDILAYLHVINNRTDDLRLKRIINNPPRGLGPKTIETAQRLADAEGKSLNVTNL